MHFWTNNAFYKEQDAERLFSECCAVDPKTILESEEHKKCLELKKKKKNPQYINNNWME